ncbi:MAG: hypothetical protein WCG20_03435 [bacterium]
MRPVSITNTISLFFIHDHFNYDQIIATLNKQGFDPLTGNTVIQELYKKQDLLPLPRNGNYIIGLTTKKQMQQVPYPCGTILYYYPIMYEVTRGPYTGYHLGESCISESGCIDNFINCYVIAVKNPLP